MNKKRNKKNKQKTTNSFQFSRMMGSILLILLILIAGVFLYRLLFPKSPINKGSTVSLPLSQTTNKAEKGQQAKYTFYDNLKKRTSGLNNYEKPQPIIILESAKSSANDKSVGQQLMSSDQPQTPSGVIYNLQVGAFKNEDTAKRLQAKMILDAYPAHIINSNGVYKVQIGPYSSKLEIDKVSQQLKSKGMNTILRKN